MGAKKSMKLAVCGAHLKGQPLHYQLEQLGAKFICATRTNPKYDFYALIPKPNSPIPISRPGLIRNNSKGHSIEVEVYELEDVAAGKFLDHSVKEPLCLGTLELENNENVKGFLCEHYVVTSGDYEIVNLGDQGVVSWRQYLKSNEFCFLK